MGGGGATVAYGICQHVVINVSLMLFHVYFCRVKGKRFPYSLPSVGPGADDAGVQAVSPAVGCHYGYLPSRRSPPLVSETSCGPCAIAELRIR